MAQTEAAAGPKTSGVVRDSRTPRHPPRATGFAHLLEDKAWSLLGMTGQEFLRAYYQGAFRLDPSPAAAALVRLVETGSWVDPARG